MFLYEKYLYFIRLKVEKKWLSKFKYLTVLGEGFINGFYILIFEVDDRLETIEELNKKCKDLF